MVLRNVEAKVVGLNNIVVWANPAFRYYQTNLSKGSLSDMGRMLALTPEQKKVRESRWVSVMDTTVQQRGWESPELRGSSLFSGGTSTSKGWVG